MNTPLRLFLVELRSRLASALDVLSTPLAAATPAAPTRLLPPPCPRRRADCPAAPAAATAAPPPRPLHPTVRPPPHPCRGRTPAAIFHAHPLPCPPNPARPAGPPLAPTELRS